MSLFQEIKFQEFEFRSLNFRNLISEVCHGSLHFTTLYTLLVCLSVCLGVCLYPNKGQTAEPIGLKVLWDLA